MRLSAMRVMVCEVQYMLVAFSKLPPVVIPRAIHNVRVHVEHIGEVWFVIVYMGQEAGASVRTTKRFPLRARMDATVRY